MTFRVKPSAPGTIEVRQGAPDGPLLAEVSLEAEAMEPVAELPQARAVAEMLASAEAILVEGLNLDAYKEWGDVSVDVTDPGGTHELFLVFRSEATKPFVELDWIRFGGLGMGYETMQQ